jgi:hypothetical protein
MDSFFLPPQIWLRRFPVRSFTIHCVLIVLIMQRYELLTKSLEEENLSTVQPAVTQNWAAVFFKSLSRGSSCCHCFDLHRRMTGNCYVMLRLQISVETLRIVSFFALADFRHAFMCYINTYFSNYMEQSPT